MNIDTAIICIFGCGIVLGVLIKWVYDNGYNTNKQSVNITFREDLKIGDEFVSGDTNSKSLWIKDDDTQDDSSKIRITNIKRDLSEIEYVFTEIGGKTTVVPSNYTMATSYLYSAYNKIPTPSGDD